MIVLFGLFAYVLFLESAEKLAGMGILVKVTFQGDQKFVKISEAKLSELFNEGKFKVLNAFFRNRLDFYFL